MNAKVVGIGKYLPQRVVTNFDLTELLDTSDDWIQQRTGIIQRHWAHENQTTTDLAFFAAKSAMEDAGLAVDQIDCLIFGTLIPDYYFPGCGVILQRKLGLSHIPCFDLRQQCSFFVHAVSMVDSFIKRGIFKRILVVGAEVHSKGLDLSPSGRDVSVLFGDGAGAMVFEADQTIDSDIISYDLGADGTFAEDLMIKNPGCSGAKMFDPEDLKNRSVFPYMKGKSVFVNAVQRLPETMFRCAKKANINILDIDLFILHQANLRINEHVAKTLGIVDEKIFNTIQKYGNTTAATIPIGWADAVAEGRLKRGMKVMSAAFGAGYTWGSFIIHY